MPPIDPKAKPDWLAPGFKQGLVTDTELLASEAAAQLADGPLPVIAATTVELPAGSGNLASEAAAQLVEDAPPFTSPTGKIESITLQRGSDETSRALAAWHKMTEDDLRPAGKIEFAPGKVSATPDEAPTSSLKPGDRWLRVWQVAAALLLIVPLVVGAGMFLGQSSDGDAMGPAGALASPKKSDPPAGPVELSTPDMASGGGDAGGDPNETSTVGGQEPGASSAPAVPTLKPAPKPDATVVVAKPTPDEGKPTAETNPTPAPDGKHKISPRFVEASCVQGLSAFDLIIDNTSGSVDVNWSIEIGPGPFGPWGSATETSGTTVTAQFKVVTITPYDLCKGVTTTKEYEITVFVNGADTLVTYTVSPP